MEDKKIVSNKIAGEPTKNLDDLLFYYLSDSDGKVPLSKFLRGLRESGLMKSDPRLRGPMKKIKGLTSAEDIDDIGNLLLEPESFKDCIRDSFMLIWRAFTGDFVIPEFSNFCRTVNDIYNSCRSVTDGQVSSYIPQLAKFSRDLWGVSVCTVDGQRHSIGDVNVPFTIQSSGIPINYALTLNQMGASKVHQYVGHEPSGESFNNIKLSANNKPFNPMINAGALVVTSLYEPQLPLSERFAHIMEQYRQITGGEFVGFNNSMFLAEREIGHRNYALGHYLKENKCFPPDTNLSNVMDLYFQLCSVEINCLSGSVIAATLANGGFCPITGERILDSVSVQNTLSLMHSCGMLDYSGTFAFKVGLPAKSGISGCILLVIPSVLGMCLWSPAVDKVGNSVRGLRFCEQLVKEFNFHYYDNLRHTAHKSDPRYRRSDVQGSHVSNLLFAAYNGDITALRRIALAKHNMSVPDYDGRTALHLATSEGHLECVKFLIERCYVELNPKDRWGNSPIDDAIKFKYDDIREYLEKQQQQQQELQQQ